VSRVLTAVVVVMVTSCGAFALRATVSCSRWQDRYKRFIYAEWIKISPFVYGPRRIEAVVGSRPLGCAPPGGLTHEDVDRYRSEGVGPNEFTEEILARRRSGEG
jgi:hypothetical protein